jgi:hypothetical protein
MSEAVVREADDSAVKGSLSVQLSERPREEFTHKGFVASQTTPDQRP